jgi:hypothetical protein
VNARDVFYVGMSNAASGIIQRIKQFPARCLIEAQATSADAVAGIAEVYAAKF